MGEPIETPSEDRRGGVMQFRLIHLFYLMGFVSLLSMTTLISGWWEFAIVNLVIVSIVVWIVLYWLLGGVSEKTHRRVFAVTASIMAGAGFVLLLATAGGGAHVPLVWFAEAMLCSWVSEIVGTLMPQWMSVGFAALLLLVIHYAVWLGVFKSWSSMESFVYSSPHRNQQPLASAYSLLMAVLMLPVAVVVLTQGCCWFSGHRMGRVIIHLPCHCIAHVSVLVLGLAVITCLNVVCRKTINPAPDWLKMLVWGYLCLYSVLAQTVLFPIVFLF